jgi:hypothetical protein
MTQKRHLQAFAQAYGAASPQSLIDVVNRRKEPGVKTQARMLRLVTEKYELGVREPSGNASASCMTFMDYCAHSVLRVGTKRQYRSIKAGTGGDPARFL